MTRKIRNNPDRIGVKEVFENGIKIAEYHFCRDRREQGGRISIKCSGLLTYEDGRIVPLNNYCWAADVARDIKNCLL